MQMRISVWSVLAVAIIVSMVMIGGCAKQSADIESGGESGVVVQDPVADKGGEVKSAVKGAGNFSADIEETVGDRTSKGKLYVKGKKMRREIAEGDTKQIVILDMDKDVTWLIDPAAKTAMEIKGVTAMMPNEENAEEMLKDLGTRKHVGKETVNGQVCDKYVFTFHNANMGTQTQRVSQKLGIMVRMEGQDAGVKMIQDVKNIQVTKVSDSLFEVPSDYTKVAMPGMPQMP